MQNYYQGNSDHPSHVSVGAVLVNDSGEVCVNYYGESKGYWGDSGVSDFYTLMRETLEPNQTLEEAVAHGLQIEFGAKGTIADYLGSVTAQFEHNSVTVEKTTLYFLVRLQSQDLQTRGDQEEKNGGVVEWRNAEYLIEKMKQQAKRYARTDIDESSILVIVRRKM